jgi:hypothetical protein
MTKTYLQFRRLLRQYHRHETPEERKRILGPRFRAFWQNQYKLWASGNRGVDVSDATCAVMLS